jgi:WD40 repeat protein/tRNA A-37 threonylcarbamoyl transferase component Bud32
MTSDAREQQLDEVLAAILEARARGWAPDRRRLLACYPHLADDLARFFAGEDLVEKVAAPLRPDEPAAAQPASSDTTVGPHPSTEPSPGWPRVPGYEILQEVARGGMGVVYKARQLRADRVVALKMILAGGHSSPAERKRFRREAEAVARLQHPNVVQIHEVGEHDGLPFFSLEFCPGGSLADKLAGTPLPPQAAARLVETLARAVHAAHRANVVHRDLKPANVLLLEDGTPKVTDFGLAKKLDVSGQTQTGAVVGTPSYMAPEQAGGRSKEMGPACDVYGLGAILYELLVGRPPFKAATALDTLMQVLSEEPVPVRRLQPKVPRDLETVCHKCLEKEPRQRYASAEELAEDLRRFGAGEPVAARPVGAVGRVVRWARRRPAVAGLLVAVVAAAAVGLAGILLAYGEARQSAKTAREEAENARREKQRADAKADEATKEARRADGNATAAREKEKEALQQAYFAQIGRTEAQLQAQDHAGALMMLDGMGQEYRGWEYGYLRRRAEGTPLLLRGHNGEVSSVAYSPDGSRLASASGLEIKLWDAHRGAELTTLRGHTSWVSSASYSPDGARLASASGDKTVKVWDAHSGAELATLRGHTGYVLSVTYSPDGTRLASASEDKTVKLWDARSGAAVATLRAHANAVTAVCYSPDGNRLASASGDSTVKLWDAKSGAEITTLRGHTGRVDSVAYSPDGSHIASAGGESNQPGGVVKLWDAHSGALLATLRGHADWVNAVAYRPDGSRLASASRDNTVKLWDAKSGAEIATLRGHAHWVLAVSYSPDDMRLASASLDKTVKIWDATGAAEVTTLRGHTRLVRSVAYSPDGTRLASSSYDETVKLWDTRSGALLATLRGHATGMSPVAYSPDGSSLVSAARDRTVRVWDAKSGAEIATLRGHTGIVYAVAYSPDGTRLASAADDGTVKVWDAKSGADIATLRGHNSEVRSVVFSPDGMRLASASFLPENMVKLWDARSGAELATLRGHTLAVFSLAYSPGGTRLASASGDGTVKLWDAKSGAELATLRGHTGAVFAVAYSPGGTRLASASLDKTIKVWDARSGAHIAALRGHTGPVWWLVYSPDGSRLASASGDNTVKLWDARISQALLGEPRQPAPGSYDPWAEIRYRYTALAPAWHAEEAAAAVKAGNAFAAAFHRRRLLEGDNLRLLASHRLAAGDQKAFMQAIGALRNQHRMLAELAPAGPLFAVLAAGPTPGMSTAPAASALEHEQRRLAAQLVRAAAVQPESGVPAAGLVSLARSCVAAEPQSWQARELLGAALYRDGKADAVRELGEAVRLHGKGGSLWTRLFLALAHQRLGHAEEARKWLPQAKDASAWEDKVMQMQLLRELAAMKPPAP